MGSRHATDWTVLDDALWTTLRVAHALVRPGQPLPTIGTSFRLSDAPAERALGRTPYRSFSFGVTGDGSYDHRSTTVFATGRDGLVLTAGVLAATEIANHRRRQEAAWEATARWVPLDAGELIVTTHGFYLHSLLGLWHRRWAAVHGMEVWGPSTLVVHFADAASGPPLRLHSYATELMFVLWAMLENPGHPQLADGAWLPPGFVARALARYGTEHLDAAALVRELPIARSQRAS